MTRVFSHIDIGLRENVEDAAGGLTVTAAVPWPAQIAILTVADGAGGQKSGEVASELALRLIPSFLAGGFAASVSAGPEDCLSPDCILETLTKALAYANQAIVERAGSSPGLAGMATTVVCGVVVDNVLYLAWAGDSRCYLISQGQLRLLTHDHSEVQRLIDQGLICQGDAGSHPLAHTINRYLGQASNFIPQTRVFGLAADDVVLLCTDGLTDVLADGRIAEVLRGCRLKELPLDELPGRLVEEALASGASDNVTVLCYQHAPGSRQANPSPDRTLTGAYPVALAGMFSNSKET
jgi:PPM family protein phosphatase